MIPTTLLSKPNKSPCAVTTKSDPAASPSPVAIMRYEDESKPSSLSRFVEESAIACAFVRAPFVSRAACRYSLVYYIDIQREWRGTYPSKIKTCVPRFPWFVHPKTDRDIIRNEQTESAILRQWRAGETTRTTYTSKHSRIEHH